MVTSALTGGKGGAPSQGGTLSATPANQNVNKGQPFLTPSGAPDISTRQQVEQVNFSNLPSGVTPSQVQQANLASIQAQQQAQAQAQQAQAQKQQVVPPSSIFGVSNEEQLAAFRSQQLAANIAQRQGAGLKISQRELATFVEQGARAGYAPEQLIDLRPTTNTPVDATPLGLAAPAVFGGGGFLGSNIPTKQLVPQTEKPAGLPSKNFLETDKQFQARTGQYSQLSDESTDQFQSRLRFGQQFLGQTLSYPSLFKLNQEIVKQQEGRKNIENQIRQELINKMSLFPTLVNTDIITGKQALTKEGDALLNKQLPVAIKTYDDSIKRISKGYDEVREGKIIRGVSDEIAGQFKAGNTIAGTKAAAVFAGVTVAATLALPILAAAGVGGTTAAVSTTLLSTATGATFLFGGGGTASRYLTSDVYDPLGRKFSFGEVSAQEFLPVAVPAYAFAGLGIAAEFAGEAGRGAFLKPFADVSTFGDPYLTKIQAGLKGAGSVDQILPATTIKEIAEPTALGKRFGVAPRVKYYEVLPSTVRGAAGVEGVPKPAEGKIGRTAVIREGEGLSLGRFDILERTVKVPEGGTAQQVAPNRAFTGVEVGKLEAGKLGGTGDFNDVIADLLAGKAGQTRARYLLALTPKEVPAGAKTVPVRYLIAEGTVGRAGELTAQGFAEELGLSKPRADTVRDNIFSSERVGNELTAKEGEYYDLPEGVTVERKAGAGSRLRGYQAELDALLKSPAPSKKLGKAPASAYFDPNQYFPDQVSDFFNAGEPAKGVTPAEPFTLTELPSERGRLRFPETEGAERAIAERLARKRLSLPKVDERLSFESQFEQFKFTPLGTAQVEPELAKLGIPSGQRQFFQQEGFPYGLPKENLPSSRSTLNARLLSRTKEGKVTTEQYFVTGQTEREPAARRSLLPRGKRGQLSLDLLPNRDLLVLNPELESTSVQEPPETIFEPERTGKTIRPEQPASVEAGFGELARDFPRTETANPLARLGFIQPALRVQVQQPKIKTSTSIKNYFEPDTSEDVRADIKNPVDTIFNVQQIPVTEQRISTQQVNVNQNITFLTDFGNTTPPPPTEQTGFPKFFSGFGGGQGLEEGAGKGRGGSQKGYVPSILAVELNLKGNYEDAVGGLRFLPEEKQEQKGSAGDLEFFRAIGKSRIIGVKVPIKSGRAIKTKNVRGLEFLSDGL